MKSLRLRFKHIKEEHRFAYFLPVILVILVVFLAAIVLRQIPPLPEVRSYSIFVDILMFNLAAIGILMSVIAYAMYKTLEDKLKAESLSNFNKFYKPAEAKIMTAISYIHFEGYRIHNNKADLEKAIEVAQLAHDIANKLDKENLTNVEIYGNAINNLSFFMAHRGEKKDELIVRKYAEILEQNLPQFPHCASTWTDTIDFINNKEFPKS